MRSFEGLPKHRPKLKALKLQGICIILVVDEVHFLKDCKGPFKSDSGLTTRGFRDFRNFWTVAAAVDPQFVRSRCTDPRYFYFSTCVDHRIRQVLALTATLRPRDELLAASACGISGWTHIMRASCLRPAVDASCHVYDNEAAALMALLEFRPQLVSSSCTRYMLR